MLKHPESAELQSRLQLCLALAQPWQGTFFRATTLEYANRFDLLSGAGSRQTGGRWNPPGRFSAVYGCLDPETAMAEALANYREFGIPVSQAMPLVFVAVVAKLQKVLDLTAAEVQQHLEVSTRKMTTVPWLKLQRQGEEALTQAIGRLAWEGKLEGILVPSARKKPGQNIVLFPSRRLRGSSWKIAKARDLPKPADE